MPTRSRILSAADRLRRDARTWCGGFAVSAVVHLLLLAPLALVVMARGDVPVPLSTIIAAEPVESPAAVDELRVVTPAPIEDQGDSLDPGGSSARELLGAAGTEPTAALGEPWWHTPGVPQSVGFGLPSKGLGGRVGAGSPTGGEHLGNGIGTGLGDGVGDGSGKGFFGIRAGGKRVAYVVDCSGSMNQPHAGQWKTRFGRVKFEILKSVGAMTEDQQFFIVYFNHAALPMPNTTMQPATEQVKQHYLEWMARAVAHGDTDPIEALEMAMRLQPDVIYFLTDGSFPKWTIYQLRQLRQNRTAIHTFTFGDPAGERLMKDIAAKNGGEYHFIPEDEPAAEDEQQVAVP